MRKWWRKGGPRPSEPSLAYVFISGPSENEARLRGLAYFQRMLDAGQPVQIVRPDEGTTGFTINDGTVIYANVPFTDMTEMAERVRTFSDGCPTNVTLLLDCHFPITDIPDIWVEGEDLQKYSVLFDSIPTILANLRFADAVTVPHPQWAGDLLGVDPDLNVYILPDLVDDTQVDDFEVRFKSIVSDCRSR